MNFKEKVESGIIKIKYPDLMNSDISLEEAKNLQMEYRKIIENELDLKEHIPQLDDIEFLCALDTSFFEKMKASYGTACAVQWNMQTNSLEGFEFATDKLNFNYKAGYLGFREIELSVQVLQKLSKKPDVLMCDGHGIIHPRKFGEAVHVGMCVDIPSIGVAKNFFIGHSNWKSMERIKGNKEAIYESNLKERILGYAVCTNENMKPIFISAGYHTSLELALSITLKTSDQHRIPEPLYLADRYSRNYINKFK